MNGRLESLLGLFLLALAPLPSGAARAEAGCIIGGGIICSTPAPGGTVSFDAVASTPVSAVGTNYSWTHTPVGTPTGVAVGIQLYTGGSCTSISSVTYGGTPMTQATSVAITDATTLVAMYGLANPPSGAQTVVVTMNTNCGMFSQARSATVTGGNTTTVFRAANSAQGNSTTPGVSVTSAFGDLVVDIEGNPTSTTTPTAGGSQTKQWGTQWQQLGIWFNISGRLQWHRNVMDVGNRTALGQCCRVVSAMTEMTGFRSSQRDLSRSRRESDQGHHERKQDHGKSKNKNALCGAQAVHGNPQ
jgi:hypothetical protein